MFLVTVKTIRNSYLDKVNINIIFPYKNILYSVSSLHQSNIVPSFTIVKPESVNMGSSSFRRFFVTTMDDFFFFGIKTMKVTYWICQWCRRTRPEKSSHYSRSAGRSLGHIVPSEVGVVDQTCFYAPQCQ